MSDRSQDGTNERKRIQKHVFIELHAVNIFLEYDHSRSEEDSTILVLHSNAPISFFQIKQIKQFPILIPSFFVSESRNVSSSSR